MDALAASIQPRPAHAVIHPTAIVSRDAEIGAGVCIGPFCTVGPDAVIDDGARLISHVVVDGHSVIGANAVVYPFCTVGMAPQDLKYRGEPTRCVIGPRTQLREHCTVHRGSAHGRGVTEIGADCMLMAVTHVAHDCRIGDGVIIANNVVMGGHVQIADHAVIGGSAALHQFVRIGRAAMVGGVSGVEADVPPFTTVLGNRARVAGLNVIGLRRRGYDRQQIHRVRIGFRSLFHGDGTFAERLERTRERFGMDPLIAEILEFIETPSPRGLIRSSTPAAE
ncbi:MAG TPA: acyl-ACP--UDP-N-acetylglucosamine O-acyltransferase [Acetobacteraceae bacterium]|nr:acyl-ACP--UDP-N-acetylglucosamine O-acyltransferase [Acetobacteraceae bacterium]